MSARVYRPTAILKYEDCPRAYHYQYVEKIQPAAASSNLVFGEAVHKAVLGYLRGEVQDPASKFREEWQKATEEQAIAYNATFGPEDLEETGAALCGQFPEYWDKTGLMPLVDEHGLVVERRFRVPLAEGIELSAEPDLVAMNQDGEVFIIDVKTPASEPPEGWVSDQLLGYQLAVEGHGEWLGIERISGLGYINMLKRKVPKKGRRGTGPTIAPLTFQPRADNERLREYVQKLVWIDEDIRRGRFPRRSRMAHNTPCNLCDFAGLCLRGDPTGLKQSEEKGQQGSLV